MTWTTRTLEQVRQSNRDYIAGALASGAIIPNSVLRVLADANAGLAYLDLLAINSYSQQFLPDTANEDWLKNRHAQIWLGGYKKASFSEGTVTFTGSEGAVVPSGQRLGITVSSDTILVETTAQITIGEDGVPTPALVQALTAGKAGNLDQGTQLGLVSAISGVDSSAVVVSLTGGADEENVDDLRIRVLERIREPPMGGDADDYKAWAKEVPGVTRAWCSPKEMGPGTVTVRFMMDDLRATDDPTTNGFPLDEDIIAVQAHLDAKRPVTVQDFFVFGPIPEPINFTIADLVRDTPSTRANIAKSIDAMLADKARPAYAQNGVGVAAQTIYSAWISEAVLEAAGVDHFDLVMDDHEMPNKGAMGVRGAITYA